MWILFFASFLAATLLPAQSESILWWQLYKGDFPPLGLTALRHKRQCAGLLGELGSG